MHYWCCCVITGLMLPVRLDTKHLQWSGRLMNSGWWWEQRGAEVKVVVLGPVAQK